MSIETGALLWSLTGLTAAGLLLAAAGRLGRARAAAWLVVLGLVMLSVEEPLLTLFWTLTGPEVDRDGMASLITAPASAHVLDAAILATTFMVLLGWVAMTGLRRGEPWATRILAVAWAVAAAGIALTAVTVYARGLPLPTPGGRAEGAGYGWEQLAVGLLAWASGLWLARTGPAATPSPRHAPAERR